MEDSLTCREAREYIDEASSAPRKRPSSLPVFRLSLRCLLREKKPPDLPPDDDCRDLSAYAITAVARVQTQRRRGAR